MQFENIMKNITGLSCPIFGIQWNAPVIECNEAKNIIVFLENKRVLFNPSQMEDYRHCSSSVESIRNEITKQLQILSNKNQLEKSLRKMRTSSIKFMNVINENNLKNFIEPIQKSILDRELISLRRKFGIAIAELSITYGLDVDDNLASIIPFNNMNNL